MGLFSPITVQNPLLGQRNNFVCYGDSLCTVEHPPHFDLSGLSCPIHVVLQKS